MLKKVITFDDLDGNEVSEAFYFNFHKLEIMEMDLEFEGGLEGVMQQLIETENAAKAYDLFRTIVLRAYGEKSADGRRFIKKDEDGRPLSKRLEDSPALGEMIFEMLQDPNAGAQFIEQVLPKKLVEESKKLAEAKESNTSEPEVASTVTPQKLAEVKKPTRKELTEMTREELIEAYKQRNAE